MAISRSQLLKELLPGLNALFGLEYSRYGEEHKEIYETENSERSFEEETKLSGFSAASVAPTARVEARCAVVALCFTVAVSCLMVAAVCCRFAA